MHLRYHCISVHPPSLLEDLLGGCDRASLEMHLEAVSVWTYRLESSVFGDTLGGRDGVNLQMHSEIVIERVWRYTWRPWPSEFGGHHRASLEIHLEAVIERVWRCTWRPGSSEIGGVLGGGKSGGGSSGGRRDGSWDSIHWLTRNCGNVENWVQHGLPRDDTGWETVDTGMMQYTVYAVLGVYSWSWHGEIESDDLTSCS